MSQRKPLELTHGAIMPALAKLALPIMATAFVQMAYNLTDMAWIGFLGANSVAAVGAAGMYTWFAQGVMNISKMGGQVMVAQSIGAGNLREAHAFLRGGLQLAVTLALIYGAVCLLFAEELIGFFRLSGADTAAQAEIYLRITGGMIFFAFLNQTLTGLYTSVGDSKTPFMANCIGLFGNMLFDPMLIFGIGPFPRMGVAGAAAATVSAQAVVTLALILLRTRSGSEVLTHMSVLGRTELRYFKTIARIGLPASVQTMVYCGISMVLTRMVSAWGDAAIAVQRVGSQIESLGWMTGEGFGAAVNAFVAQNYGARRLDRIRKSYHASIILMIGWGLFVTCVLYFGAESLFRLFIHEEAIVPEGINYMRIISFGEFPMCLELMTVGALSGLGRTGTCSVVSMTLTGARIPIALFLSATVLGLSGIWWAFTVSSIAKGFVFTIVFLLILRSLETKKYRTAG